MVPIIYELCNEKAEYIGDWRKLGGKTIFACNNPRFNT